MKLILALMLSISSTFAFTLQGYCQFNQAVAYCTVCNDLQQGIACKMTANGQSSYGYTLQQFASSILYPGQCMNLNVRANNPYRDPLVWADATANCSF